MVSCCCSVLLACCCQFVTKLNNGNVVQDLDTERLLLESLLVTKNVLVLHLMLICTFSECSQTTRFVLLNFAQCSVMSSTSDIATESMEGIL